MSKYKSVYVLNSAWMIVSFLSLKKAQLQLTKIRANKFLLITVD
jgi:hypothetical protein